MNHTIHKYPLAFTHEHRTIVNLPARAEILDVQIQGGLFVLWALVNKDEEELEARHFRMYGTGWDIDDDIEMDKLRHVATRQNGMYVWHVFEEVS